jgi:aminoglycoside phosphotransferase (APT) family kinase protein
MPMTTSDVSESALHAALARLMPAASRIADLRALAGGASQQTWSFDALTAQGAVPLILRRAPPGSLPPAEAIGLATEAALLARLQGSGVPVPKVLGVLIAQDGLGEGYVMERVAGEANSRRILREPRFAAARSRLARQCGAALAAMHRIALAPLPPLPSAHAHEALGFYRRQHDRVGIPRPVFELAFQWLQQRLPGAPAATALVHGDFRNGNLMVDEQGLCSVLDWEMAHLGDPMEDLGWLCVNAWRYGHEAPVGGFGSREDLYAGYEAAGGRVDPARVRFWEVLGTLKWGVICEAMARSWQNGEVRTVERAAVGRRASESEIDLLCLMREGD